MNCKINHELESASYTYVLSASYTYVLSASYTDVLSASYIYMLSSLYNYVLYPCPLLEEIVHFNLHYIRGIIRCNHSNLLIFCDVELCRFEAVSKI